MDYRQVTPPMEFDADGCDTFGCAEGSVSTNVSYGLYDWSPESVATAGTAATTPPRSPSTIRQLGPALLPRVRAQDHLIESSGNQHSRGHHRTGSLPVKTLALPYNNYPSHQHPWVDRRSMTPEVVHMATPGSVPLYFEHNILDPAPQRPAMGARSMSTSNVHCHSRNSSSTGVDASVLGRYGFPTYRQSPGPQPLPTPMSRTPSAMSHLAPIGQMQSYPARRRTASPPARPSRLSSEVDFDPILDFEESSILEYLTQPNPIPTLTQRAVEGQRAQNTHFWYDIRNVATWSDFTVDTITDIPGLLDLLKVKVIKRSLPTPARVGTNPETPSQLIDLCASHHAVKVNAALRLSQGEKHMAMKTLKSIPGSKPEFVSNYESAVEQIIYGDGRGRVIGIVKCYDQWNSGMRTGNPGEKVKYLQALALLQRFMREHECRYGFVMTEIELVCVRAGGMPIEKNVPLFGHVEVAEPVRIATFGLEADGRMQMTAGLALWYLHMLAKEQPLPGQYHWKVNVGPPAQLTRQHHLPRDTWMPKPNLSETREAKRIRGWVWPNEALSKRECGRGRRTKN